MQHNSDHKLDQPAHEVDAQHAQSKREPKKFLWICKKYLWMLLLRIVVIYVLVCIGIALFQRKLIYFPTNHYDRFPTDVGLKYESIELEAADGVKLRAWFTPSNLRPKMAESRTILMFHGNAGNIADRLHTLRRIHDLGFNSLILDYRGYGESQGRPAESGIYLDSRAALQYLTEERGVSPESLIYFGRSLGGAVAVELASEYPPGVLVLESTFTRMADVAGIQYPILPANFILVDRYDSLALAPKIQCPVIIFHGIDDQLIPISIGRKLHDGFTGESEFIETPGGHNEGGWTYSDKFEAQLADFLANHP